MPIFHNPLKQGRITHLAKGAMQIQQCDVYGVGHALVDVQYAVEPRFLQLMGIEKGVMTIIDRRRQEQLAAALVHPPIVSCSGGSAANTMIGVATFGGTAYYGCQVGDDDWGDFYLRDLSTAGVGCSDRSRVPGVTGQCTVLITPDADRTLNTFLGVGSQIGPDQVDAAIVARSKFVYLEGYLASSDNGMETCREAQRAARKRGVPVALTLSDPSVVTTVREHFAELIGAGVAVIFCNEDEAKAYTRLGTLHAAGRKLSQLAPMVCVTCGAQGVLLYRDGAESHVPGQPAQAVDTTGAGDLFAGGVLFGLAHGYSLEQAGRLGTYAAAQVVARFGSRLDLSLASAVDSILAPH